MPQSLQEASVAAAESHLAELTLLFQRADTANYDLGNHIVDLGTNGAALAQLSRHPTHVPALSFAPTGTESWPRDHSPLQASLSRSTAGDSTGSSVGSSGAASGSLAGCSSADTSSARVEVEHLGNALKRQYADRLSALQEEFNCKRSKGKLPDEAIEQLKQWWQQHPYWPYPTA
ncbi:homeobox domain-containing protein, partial [Haematococcus lacustris]